MTLPLPSNHPSQSTQAMPVHDAVAVVEDELLVAYLDGELDGQSVSELEGKLASDSKLRLRLDQLRSAWDLLEELPVSLPNPNFAQSTIEMVAMSAAVLDATPATKRVQRRRWLAPLLVLPMLFAIGYIATRGWQRWQERQAIEMLHVLADWDALEAVGSYEWFEKLREVKDLTRVARRTSNSELSIGVVPPTISERRAWIAELSPTDRDRLSANLDKFKQFKRPELAAQHAQIVELANRLYASSDPEGNLQIARSYAYFLSDMSINDRNSHRGEKDQTKRLDELKHRVNRKLVEVYANELTAESPDRLAVEQWKTQMKNIYRGSPLDSVESDLQWRLALRESVIAEEDLDSLMDSLTPEAQEIVGRLQSPELQQMALIMHFISPSPSMMRRRIDRAEAIEQFKRLPQSRQAELEFSPPEKVQGQLGVGSDPSDSRRRRGPR
ncbi:MAG: hypothetical protein IT423_21535 [Pirellulaceae bacterium]|nr:hypothetical protein [Pirellulaceae bacterium]